MLRKYLLPLMALCGLMFAVYTVINSSKPVPAAQPVALPSQAPFSSYVAGAGIIEASTENIAVGTIVPGVVTEIFVKIGDEVKAGAPLFKVDDRDLRAQLEIRRGALKVAQAQLQRLESQPRPEEIPPAEARVKEATANLQDLRNQLNLWESVGDQRAVSQEELIRKRFAVSQAEARLQQAQAQLDLLKAGAWKPEIEVARAQVESAEAQVRAMEIDIERLTVRAPVDGQVLQVKIRRGEYAPAGVLQTPLMLLGNVEYLHVRVDVDENDAWRIRRDAEAMAYVRGNRELKTPLEFVRIEPYVVPKRSLTGESTERVDTRVLQVIYRFHRDKLPVYVGQQMDVFIEAPPVVATMPALAAHH